MNRSLVIFIVLFTILLPYKSISQNIGIGNTNPHTSALLDISSNSKGLLIPRLSTVQRNAILSPAKGLMVYDSTANSFWYFNGSAWTSMASGAGAFTLPYEGTASSVSAAFKINNSGGAIEATSNTGTALNLFSVSGTGLNIFSSSGFGLIATSGTSTPVYAFSSNALPTINASNSSTGAGVQASSSMHHGVMGSSAGTSKAGIRGEATGASGIGVFGITSSTSGYGVFGNSTTGTGVYGFSTSGTGVKAFSSTGLALEVQGNVKISGGTAMPSNGAVLTSDANGNATWKNNKIAFAVQGVHLDKRGLATNNFNRIHFKQEIYDYGDAFSLLIGLSPGIASSTFTVPVSGVYHFDAGVKIAAENSFLWGVLRLVVNRNGTIIEQMRSDALVVDRNYNSLGTLSLSKDIKLIAGDRIYVEILQHSNSAGEIDGTENTKWPYFNGHLVFAD